MDKVKVELTQEQQVIVDAVIAGVEHSLKHECMFSKEHRKALHELADAIDETKATRGTHILILSAGKVWEDVTRKMSRGILWFAIIAAAALVTLFAGKPLLDFIKGN